MSCSKVTVRVQSKCWVMIGSSSPTGWDLLVGVEGDGRAQGEVGAAGADADGVGAGFDGPGPVVPHGEHAVGQGHLDVRALPGGDVDRGEPGQPPDRPLESAVGSFEVDLHDLLAV